MAFYGGHPPIQLYPCYPQVIIVMMMRMMMMMMMMMIMTLRAPRC